MTQIFSNAQIQEAIEKINSLKQQRDFINTEISENETEVKELESRIQELLEIEDYDSAKPLGKKKDKLKLRSERLNKVLITLIDRIEDLGVGVVWMKEGQNES